MAHNNNDSSGGRNTNSDNQTLLQDMGEVDSLTANPAFSSVAKVCSLDWDRVLKYNKKYSPTIESIIKNNSAFRLGIYECYHEFFNIYRDHAKAYSRVRKLLSEYLEDPTFGSLECASFTQNEEQIVIYLSDACKSLRIETGDSYEERIEHTILVYILKLLVEDDGCKDLPKVKFCSGKDCIFGAHP